MKRFKYIQATALLGLMLVSATSCDDFLTLYPQDRVVEEDFWEDKNDLEGVRYGAYKQMAGTIKKLIIWGDIRSDAYYLNQDYHSQADYYTYKKILLAQLDSTMGFYDWGDVYTTINFCNKVLSNGELVLQRDAQFTQTEWNQMKAEMTALRALNYFYLIRSFKDIPYSNEVINSDEDTHAFATTNQLDVLDILIKDVRSVAGQGRNRFGGTYGSQDSKGLMTNAAIYALLTDMYLWRSALHEGRGITDSLNIDADSAYFFGERCLEALATQTQQSINSQFDRSQDETDDFGSGLANAGLIKNDEMLTSYNAKQTVIVPSYRSIFQTGNSDESIFELQFNQEDERRNDVVNGFWGYTDDTTLSTSEQAVKNAIGDGNLEKDTRVWYSCTKKTTDAGDRGELEHPYLLKWNDCGFRFQSGNFKVAHTSDSYRNWIIYRKTDVMLMMAEAEAVRGNYAACRKIVDAVQKRSMLDQTTGLSAATDNNKEKCIELVMKERLMEFMGEGKRWFDLVRYAERIGGGHNADPYETQYADGAEGVEKMVEKWLVKGAYSRYESVLKNRIKNRYGLYSPIYYMELRANKGLISQNPVWNREKGLVVE